MTLVVCVCSASTVMTAKGSGSLKTSRLDRPSAATTEQILRLDNLSKCIGTSNTHL